MENIVEYIDNEIINIRFNNHNYVLDNDYFSLVNIDELIIDIFKRENSSKIANRMFFIFYFWKNKTYQEWQNILLKIIKEEQGMMLNHFIYFMYQYFQIDFIDVVILFDSTGKLKKKISYLLELPESSNTTPCKALIKSKIDIETITFYNIKETDLKTTQEMLFTQGAKKALKE